MKINLNKSMSYKCVLIDDWKEIKRKIIKIDDNTSWLVVFYISESKNMVKRMKTIINNCDSINSLNTLNTLNTSNTLNM